MRKTLVKCKIVVEDDGRLLTTYMWKRTFLWFGYWYPFGTSQGPKIPNEKLNSINDDSISKLIFENVIKTR